MRAIFIEWIKSVCKHKKLPEEIQFNAGGEVYIMGSYKLGVQEPGADIDLCCVAPRHCSREDFFTSLYQILRRDPRVKDIVLAKDAYVPVMSFDLDGVEFDLLFASLPMLSVKPDLDIDDDAILRGIDDKSRLSLNGPRTTNMISALIPSHNREVFLDVLRCVRIWAKRRGLYSNKMGYLGGVNFNILVAFISQLYPNACGVTSMHRFFKVCVQTYSFI